MDERVILASNDNFTRRNWEEFQDQQFLNQEKLLLMQPKPLGLRRWSLLPLSRGPAKIATTCDNATLCAVGSVVPAKQGNYLIIM